MTDESGTGITPVTIKDAAKRLIQIEQATGLQVYHLHYFLAAFECEPLIDYFISFGKADNFYVKTNALHSDTQLDEYESNLLDTAEKAYDVLTPLIQLKLNAQTEKIVLKSTELGKLLFEKLVGDEHTIKPKLQVIKEAHNSLDDIKGKYSQMEAGFEGMIPQISLILKQGKFYSTLSSDSKGNSWEIICHEGKIRRNSFALLDLSAGCIFLNTTISTDVLDIEIKKLKDALQKGRADGSKGAAKEVGLYLKKQAELGKKVAQQLLDPSVKQTLEEISTSLAGLSSSIEAETTKAVNPATQDAATKALFNLLTQAVEGNTRLVTVQTRLLETFRSFVTDLKLIHRLHRDLVQIGHSSFNHTYELAYQQENILEDLSTVKVTLSKNLNEWNDILDKLDEPRVKLLRRIQLGRVLASLQRLLTVPLAQFNYFKAQEVLSTIAFCCFPEKTLSYPLALNAIKAFWNAAVNAKHDETRLLREWIHTLTAQLGEPDRNMDVAPHLLKAQEASRDYLYKLIWQTNEKKMHPSLIMFCDDDTLTKEDLLRFVTCCELFPHLPFALVGVEYASPALKEVLQGWLTKIYSRNAQKKIGQLALILQDPNSTGIDYYCELIKHQVIIQHVII